MLTMIELSMRFGIKILFTDVSLQFNAGNRYGLVGANGCGKSTLIKILTGELSPDKGHILLPQQLSLGSLSQDHYIYQNQLTMDVVLQGKKRLWEAMENKRMLLEREQEACEEEECEDLFKWETVIEEEEGYAAEGEAAKLLEGLGVREEWHRRPLDLLSGGYKLRVLLAQVLFGKPHMLILDEPTNHLDLYSIKWLEEHLRRFPGTVVVTSHDRDFLNRICTHIADVDYGTIKIYPGNYDLFHQQKIVDRELKEHRLQKHDQRRSDLQGFINRFGSKATKARQAQSKARIVEKLEVEMEALDLTPSSRLYPKLSFNPLRSSGVAVLTVKGISKAYGPKKILENVSFTVERGERVAIIGPNGIGKSTLLEILTEHQTPDEGSFTWGFAVHAAYFPQDHAREVKGSFTLLEWLAQFDQERSQERLRDLLGRVLFSGDVVHQSIHTLSGGEVARLLLAKIMLQKPNVLLFDEPTNHLDIEAIDELVKALQAFEGTLLLVSHNRYFVSHLANRIMRISPQGVKDFKGTYAEYLEKEQNDDLAAKHPLSQRDVHETVEPSPSHDDYAHQKRLKGLTAQLRKKIAQAEEKCHRLEKATQALDVCMAADGFYQLTPREEQQRVIDEKDQLEKQLFEAIKEWEKFSIDLERMETPRGFS